MIDAPHTPAGFREPSLPVSSGRCGGEDDEHTDGTVIVD